MKLIAIKPIYVDGSVRTEGAEFETLEQHGRELINKGYASQVSDGDPAEPQPEGDKPKSKAKSK